MSSTSASSISTVYDFKEMDSDLICGFVANSYWGMGRDHAEIVKSVEHSYPLALFDAGRQIVFARAISDQCYLAYVCDVFVIDSYRGRGLSTRIMNDLMSHPKLSTISKWMLTTEDAGGLYEKLGFLKIPGSAYMILERFPENT